MKIGKNDVPNAYPSLPMISINAVKDKPYVGLINLFIDKIRFYIFFNHYYISFNRYSFNRYIV